MVLTLLTNLYSTYKTILIYNVRYLRHEQYYTLLAILTYNEILTLLTVLYSTLYIYITATCTTYNTDYIRYKNQKIKGAGKYGKF